MATTNGGPFVDVRQVVSLARREGERLAGRLTRDVQALVFKSPADIAADVRRLERDVRTRADAAVKQLEARRAIVFGAVEQQVTRAARLVFGRHAPAARPDVDELARRVAVLEKRLAALERGRRPRTRRPPA